MENNKVSMSTATADLVDSVEKLTASMGSCTLNDVKTRNGGAGTSPFCTNFTVRGYMLSYIQIEYLEEEYTKKPNPSLAACEIIAEALSIPNSLIIINWFAKRRQQPKKYQ